MPDLIWQIPGASTEPALAGAEKFCATPLFDLLQAAAARDPGAVALVSLANSLSYRDLFHLACNAARTVASRVRPGQAVAVVAVKQPETIAALLGCLMSGRPALILDANDPPERRDALLADAAPALVLAANSPACFAVLSPAEAVSGSDQAWIPDHVWDPDAAFAIHFTSGSTGRPKGIVLSARSSLYRAMQTIEVFGLTADSRVAQPNTPVASTGLATLLAVLATGGRVILMDFARDGVGAALGLMEREAATCASFVTATIRVMMSLQRARTAFRAMRVLRLGAGALSRADLAVARTVLPPDCGVLHAYASTEALVIAKWIVTDDRAADEITVPAGVLQLCHEYALLDGDGRAAAPGEPGEVVLRGRYVALGEWQNGGLMEGRMPPVPDRPGWRSFRTGDVARIGADGMMRMLGRVDRQVKVNGVLVQPAEIEAVLKADPRVSGAAIVARTTPSGTVLHGFVASAEADPAALIAALRRRMVAALPPVFRPAGLTVLDALPALPGGKVDFAALAERIGA